MPVDIRGPNGYTPLFQAVFSHKINAVHMLLEAGANPKLRNNQGFNALDAAAYSGCVRCVEMLLKHGAVSPHVVGRDGYTALHRAIWGDDTVRFGLACGCGASIVRLLYFASRAAFRSCACAGAYRGGGEAVGGGRLTDEGGRGARPGASGADGYGQRERGHGQAAQAYASTARVSPAR